MYRLALCVYLKGETYAYTLDNNSVWTVYPDEINMMQIEHMNVVKDRVSS